MVDDAVAAGDAVKFAQCIQHVADPSRCFKGGVTAYCVDVSLPAPPPAPPTAPPSPSSPPPAHPRLCDDASVVAAADLLADAVQHNCWWLDRSRLEDAGDTCADFLMADNADDDGVVNPGTFHRCADSPSDAARCSRSGASDAVVRCVYPPSPPPEARR